jgi:hypothetical protein
MRGVLRSCILAVVLALGASTLTGGAGGAPAAAVPQRADEPNGYGVNVASFNILSSSMRRGGVNRAHRAASAIQNTRSEVVSLQEIAADQLSVLRNRLPRYGFFPKRRYGGTGSAIQVAWKRSEYTLRDNGVIWRPNRGKARPIPWVLLADRDTGRRFFVIAIHNSPGGFERERDISTRKEIELIKRLQSRGNVAKPVFVMGDMNERVEFCTKVARATNLVSMNGGTWRRPCPVPRPAGPDWLMGTGPHVDYNAFRRHWNGISDHPLLTARPWVARNN